MSAEVQPALKEMFNAARFREIADLLADCQPGFDRKRFIKLTTTGLEPLSLLQRLRHGTRALHATLPADYPAALIVLRKLAPRIEHNFVGLLLPDFVGLYGHADFDESLAALHYFTRFSSGEFAIREFLKRDLKRTLAVMHKWSKDSNEHVRRLASEGSRPRLPWSFRLDALIADPSPALPILENLKSDPSLYVRKSVANHLNDISKDHSEWLFASIAPWPRDNHHTVWIIKRALRTLIKRGDRRAFAVVGASDRPRLELTGLKISPRSVASGGAIKFSFTLKSKTKTAQRLIVDYVVHYMKSSGKTAPKVFKLKELNLAGGHQVAFQKAHRLQELTTRRHYPGRHKLEIMVNGTVVGSASFVLTS